jgi:uncharacterized zinc-type alcohol dehydrogenase-like protein
MTRHGTALLGLADNTCVVASVSASDWEEYLGGSLQQPTEHVVGTRITCWLDNLPRSLGRGDPHVFSPLSQFDISPTASVGVVGIGGLGHLAVKFARAWGCQVTAFTSTDTKHQEALEFGAHEVLNSRDPQAIASAADRFDLLITTVNIPLDWDAYLGTLKRRGRLHVLGAVLEPLSFPMQSLMMTRRSVSSSPAGGPSDITKMLAFAGHHGIQPVTEVFPFDKVNAAIDHVRGGNARYRVVLEG